MDAGKFAFPPVAGKEGAGGPEFGAAHGVPGKIYAPNLTPANVWQRFRRIIFPLTTAGFVSGFLLTFITTMRELSLIILLVTRDTQLLASQTMKYVEAGRDQMANIVILILVVITVTGNAIIGRFSGGSLKKGLGM